MSKFKEGDRVRLLADREYNGSDWPFVPAGSLGTVTNTESDPPVLFDNGIKRYCEDDKLEPVEPVADPAPSGLHLFNFIVTEKREYRGGQLSAVYLMPGTDDTEEDELEFQEGDNFVLADLTREEFDALVVGKQYRVLIVE